MVGQQLGHYRILERIGAGGMGEVYRAHDEQLDRDVAIKLLPTSVLSDATARARLLREARSAASLNHPQICTIHEVGEADGQAYIAMELVEGQSLSARLAGGALPTEQVLRYGLQLAEALGHAHERGMVHRDLKSANIVITPEGRLKVLDFGLAKRLSENEMDEVTRSQASLTAAGALVGTLDYMAPEQLRGQPADARSDIWALGVVLYEMAASARPFQGQTGFELSSAILNQRPAPLAAKVPLELRAVIERCLEKEPARRYQRGGEVQAALEAVQTGSGAPWAGWRYRLARRRWLAVAGPVVVLAAVLVGLNVGGLRERLLTLVGARHGVPLPKIESIAVLPLENLSGDKEQDYFADGMTEELITNLAKISALKVISRTSVMQYKGTRKPLPEIAKELNVDAVVEGSVQREGGQVRITAQLIQASTDRHLWAESYQRNLRGVLALQSEIAGTIAEKVHAALTPDERARLASARPVNPEAYGDYLKGKFYLNKFTPEGFQKGLEYLNQAIEKDPTNPLPYAGLALGYTLIGHEAVPDAFQRAKAAMLKALELDENQAEAHEALAELKLYKEWDLPGAEQAFLRVLALNPNLAEAHAHYSWYQLLVGRRYEAFSEMRRAQELDPLTPLWPAWLGWQHWWTGQYEEAIAEARKSLEVNPNFPWGLHVLGGVYAEKAMYEEAIAAHQKAAASSPALRWALGYTYAVAGRRDEARKVAAELKKQVTPMNAWGLAEIYTALGEKDEAFRWLEVAYERRFSWMPWLGKERAFEPLRSEPRFQDLLRRMKLPK